MSLALVNKSQFWSTAPVPIPYRLELDASRIAVTVRQHQRLPLFERNLALTAIDSGQGLDAIHISWSR
jgi:hypothetical protein